MNSRRKIIHKIAAICCLSIFLLILVLFIIPAFFGNSFAGEFEHDFGVVPVTLPETTVKHTFEIKNQSNREIKIVNAVPTCGCTTTEWPRHIVKQGEFLEVPVDLTLKKSEIKRSRIRLEFNTGESLILRLEGTGRLAQPLSCKPHLIKIVSGDSIGGRGILKLEKYDEGLPDKPTVISPAEVTVSLAEWRYSKVGDSGQGKPNEWTMAFECLLSGELDQEELITFQYGNNEPITIRLQQTISREKPRFF